MKLQISQQYLDETWDNLFGYHDGVNETTRTIHSSPRAKFLHDMEILFSFRKGVHITITYQATFSGYWGWLSKPPEKYFEAIFPLLSRLRDTGHKVSVFVADNGGSRIDRGGWEFNFYNAEFSLEGWVEKLEEVRVMSTTFFRDANCQ